MAAGRANVDMLNGPILRPFIRYSIPIMLSGILQLLFNAADVVVVGRFAGDNALAAVGSTGSLCSLFTNLFIGLSVGANVAAARACGARDDAGLGRVVHTSVSLGLICGGAVTLLGLLFGIFLTYITESYFRFYRFLIVFALMYNLDTILGNKKEEN